MLRQQFHAVCLQPLVTIWTCPRRPQSSYSGHARLARCLGRFGKPVSEVRCKRDVGTHFGRKFALILHTGPRLLSLILEVVGTCWWLNVIADTTCRSFVPDQICYSADATLKENVAGMTRCPYTVLMIFSALLQL